jgi:hypothetical protein
MDDKLPDNIKRIDVLKLEKAKQKSCQCHTYQYSIDNENKLVYCRECGAIVDPFTALWNLTWHYECLGDQVENLLNQRKEIVNWKPWLLVFRELESRYRSKEMLPCCPECRKAFYFEKINMWTNRKLEELRRAKDKGGVE